MRKLRTILSQLAGDSGSALVLLPSILGAVAMILGILIDVSSALVAQSNLANDVQSCALKGAQALSPGAFYSTGSLTLDPSLAQSTAKSCMNDIVGFSGGSPPSVFVVSNGSMITISATLGYQVPLKIPFIGGPAPWSLHATSSAEELANP